VLHPRVVVLRGGQVLAEHSLPPGTEIVVGRSEGCGVTVTDSSVSRLHARLVADEEGVYVEDLGSANGTFVDGQRTRGRVRLADGQQVRTAQRAQSAPLVLRFEDVTAPPDGMLTAVEKVMAADETADAHAGGPARMLPPPPPPTPHEPLWRAGALPPPVAVTVPVAEIPSQAPTRQPTHGPTASHKGLVAMVAAVALVGALAAAALGAWWFLGSRRAATTASAATAVDEPAPASTTARQPSSVSPASAAVTSFPAPAEVLVVPVESDTGAATVDVGAKPTVPAAARANPLSGKWTARLENVFYPEDDYVVELDLELEQRSR
jgi:predicted component of type VI protein secretion system